MQLSPSLSDVDTQGLYTRDLPGKTNRPRPGQLPADAGAGGGSPFWPTPKPVPKIPVPIPLPTPDPTPTPPEPPKPEEQCEDNEEPDCEFARIYHLKQAQIRDEHAFKDEWDAKPNSRFDICACRDGTIKIRLHGQCGRGGPTIHTDVRWRD